MGKWNVVYLHNGIYSTIIKKETKYWYICNVVEPWTCYVKWKTQKAAHIEWLHLYEMSKIGKSL